MISPILHVEPSYLPEQGCTVSQILHLCSQECAKCIQYMLCIERRSRYVVSNRGNGYLAKSECLNKRHSLKPAHLEMVEALNVLTPRHQRKQTLPPGTQEYVKYIYCKKLLGRLVVFWRRQLISSNANKGPSSGYIETHSFWSISLWLIPHISSIIGIITMNFCHTWGQSATHCVYCGDLHK